MRLIFVSSRCPFETEQQGGAESSMWLLAKSFAEKKHDVIYLCAGQNSKNPVYWQKSFRNGIVVYTLPLLRLTSKIKVIKILLWYSTAIAMGIVCILNQRDILYCYYEPRISEMARVMRSMIKTAGFTSPKIILRVAGFYWYEKSKESKFYKKLYTRVFNHFDAVNFISEGLRRQSYVCAENAGIKLSPRFDFVKDIGVDCTLAGKKNQKVNECGGAVIRIVAAMRFSSPKRPDILIQALGNVANQVPFRLEFFGEGPEKEACENLGLEQGIYDRIHFRGYVSQEVFREELGNADLICHPTEHEGLGKVILEAMVFKVPVLCSNVVSLSDYICDGKNGFLVPNTVEGWSEAIYSVYEDPVRRFEVGARGRKFVEENYSHTKCVESFEGVFKKLIS